MEAGIAFKTLTGTINVTFAKRNSLSWVCIEVERMNALFMLTPFHLLELNLTGEIAVGAFSHETLLWHVTGVSDIPINTFGIFSIFFKPALSLW